MQVGALSKFITLLNNISIKSASQKSYTEWQEELTREEARAELCNRINPGVVEQFDKLSEEAIHTFLTRLI
jgi:chromosome segregation ATPase